MDFGLEECTSKTPVGVRCQLKVAELRPTQNAVGFDEVNDKVARYSAKDKDDPFRLMGFGHRVYKNYDPRAKIIRAVADEVLEHYVGEETPMFDLARELERIALEDDYFVERKLYPNVDFYSGLIYQAMKFPTDFFPVLFAIGRTAGWRRRSRTTPAPKSRSTSRPSG